MKHRVVGYDVARALAIFGMVIVNFEFVLNTQVDSGLWRDFVSVFEGRASALFVVLAGIGVTLMTNLARSKNSLSLMRAARQRIVKRGLMLVLIGYAYSSVWPADILHFYGVYFLIAAALLYVKDILLIRISILFTLLFCIMLFFLNYDAGWVWDEFTYEGYWTVEGMIRNLAFNGFHPIFPWCAFLLYGMWLGRQDLSSHEVRKKLFEKAFLLWASVELIFWGIRTWLYQSDLTYFDVEEINFLFHTTMMPPMPQYVVAAGSLATMVILVSLYCSEKFANRRMVKWLANTGRLSLTLYILHVVIGVGVLNHLAFQGQNGIIFSVVSAFLFCGLGVMFSVFWMRYFDIGPLEWVFRKIAK